MISLARGASIEGLHPCMRPVMRAAHRVYDAHDYVLEIINGLDGQHAAGSWHYYGLALNFGIDEMPDSELDLIYHKVREALPEYTTILEHNCLHIEVGDALAKRIGVYF